jgi:hypothetical protein
MGWGGLGLCQTFTVPGPVLGCPWARSAKCWTGHGRVRRWAAPGTVCADRSVGQPWIGTGVDRDCHGQVLIWYGPAMVGSGHVLGRIWDRYTEGWAGHRLCWQWAWLSMGSVYGLGWPWASYWLGWPWSELVTDSAGYGLGWPCAELSMGWAVHGLGWPRPGLGGSWSGLTMGRPGL